MTAISRRTRARHGSFAVRTGLVLALAALASGPTACGQTEAERAGRTVDAYAEAALEGDADAICRLFTPAYLGRLGGASECVASQSVQWDRPASEVETIGIKTRGRKAYARLLVSRAGEGPSAFALALRRLGGRWLISAQR